MIAHPEGSLSVEPLQGPIPCSKTGALYGMHAYWSKKPHDAIAAFVRHHTRPGDVVLDPFCGSGGTALAALREGRVPIAFDRSPSAVFIARHYCTRADGGAVRPVLERVVARARGDGRLYATRCDRCGGPAEIRATVFDHGSPRGPARPIEIRYRCGRCGSGSRSATGGDRAAVDAIARSPVPHGAPRFKMMHRDGVWGDCWRNGTSSFATVDELFTPRNLRALSALREAIEAEDDEATRDVLRFAFSGHVYCATTMQQVRPGGGGFAKGTYYVPGRFLERNAFDGFARRVRAVLAGKAEIPATAVAARIAQGDARSLPLADASVDYVFTDPPYEGAVQYAELNFLWEAWLGLDTTWHGDEIVVNRTRGLSREHWTAGMRAALVEIRRVLKPGAWLSLCFAATHEGSWRELERMLGDAGFEPGGTAVLEPAQKSYNRLKPTKKARHDVVVSWRKPLFQPS